MDIRKVKKLIELLDDSGIAEIEITEGEESVRISRYPAGAQVTAAPVVAHAPAPAAHFSLIAKSNTFPSSLSRMVRPSSAPTSITVRVKEK